MDRRTPVDFPVHDIIGGRYSPRGFSDRAVDAHTLACLFEAARWAPSSFNEQPWTFVLARRGDKEAFDAIIDCLTPGNQSWAHTAAVLMISVARMTFEKSGKVNRHAFHDVGIASGFLALQATALGLGLHMMAGFDAAKARVLFAIPEGFDPVAAMALGYPVEPAAMSEEARERAAKPRSRKALAEFVFARRWGEKIPDLS